MDPANQSARPSSIAFAEASGVGTGEEIQRKGGALHGFAKVTSKCRQKGLARYPNRGLFQLLPMLLLVLWLNRTDSLLSFCSFFGNHLHGVLLALFSLSEVPHCINPYCSFTIPQEAKLDRINLASSPRSPVSSRATVWYRFIDIL